jgi:protein-S-isoprenylcysteine O-methyltransferase Ste14
MVAMEKKRKIIPPVYLATALVLMWMMNCYFPLYQYNHPPFAYAGIILVLFGIGMAGISAQMFRMAETGLEPFDEATTLVTRGFYRYTRNPMYLGMFMMLFGVAILFGNVGSLLPVPVFILIIRNNFVLGEERFMESVFGQTYIEYKCEVRRWF